MVRVPATASTSSRTFCPLENFSDFMEISGFMLNDMDERDFAAQHATVIRRWRAELGTDFWNWITHVRPPAHEKRPGWRRDTFASPASKRPQGGGTGRAAQKNSDRAVLVQSRLKLYADTFF